MRSPSDTDERAGLPSASAWPRYEACPGSWTMEQKAREVGQLACGPNQWTLRGERIHAWLAGEPVELSEEERSSAELLLGRATEQRVRIFGEDTEVTHLNEKRLWLRLNGRLVASGRFDRVLYTGTLALVQDFKTGWAEPTAASQSAQMRVLAVLVGLSLPKITEVVVQIISGPFGISEARYSIGDLIELYRQIEATLAALEAPDAPLVPSPELCRKCPAQLVCPALKALVAPTSRALASPLPDGGPQAAKLLDEIAIFESHFEEVKAFYSNKLATDPDYKIPGYALVPGSARREITDWPALRQRLTEWLEPEQLDGPKPIGELERALGRVLGLSGLSAKERFNQIALDCVGKKEPAPSLKRVSGQTKFKALEAA
jgi:hypothetical protein